nr:ulp1 protease family, C-terminal catalytic domain-containing protein [Tanacetum cinerariifolium]
MQKIDEDKEWTHFRLENDDVKKRTLVSCGTKWKAFKTKIRVKFMVKNVSPLQKWTFIQPNEMRAELKADIRNEMQPEQNLFSPREDDVPNSVHTKSSLNSTTIMEETYCCLYIPSFVLAGEKVACASATVYPIGDGTVPFNKLLKGHMKVSIIKVVEIHKSMELPVLNNEMPNLESAVKGFIQWPIATIARFTGISKTPVSRVQTKCVMPQHENAPSTKKGKGNETLKEPNKQEKALEETTKHQKTMQKIDEDKEWCFLLLVWFFKGLVSFSLLCGRCILMLRHHTLGLNS